MTHPVTKSRQPFGLFLDIMDYKLVAVDGKPSRDDGPGAFIRLDSHGRMFVKTEMTNNLWEKVGVLPKDLLVRLWKSKE